MVTTQKSKKSHYLRICYLWICDFLSLSIAATIFAYGQTSSGKTFTMRGVTESVVKDIYEHIRKTQERSFVLKVSALEIYNETVVDLLNRDTGPLRLLDDPEVSKGSETLSQGS
jgi:hypothetical protein